MNRLFHRFRPHESGTFVRWVRNERHWTPYIPSDIVYVPSHDEREVQVPLQSDMGVDFDSFAEGDPVRLQFGEMTQHTSQQRGGTRYMQGNGRSRRNRIYQAFTGLHCVSAIAHGRPQVSLLSLHVMAHHFGPEVAAKHLRDWRDGASTLQKEIEVKRTRWDRDYLTLKIDKGLLTADLQVSPEIWIRGRCVNLTLQVPDTVLIALPGMAAATLTDHPVMRDPTLTITRATGNDRAVNAYVDDVLPVDDAIALLDSMTAPLAMAA